MLSKTSNSASQESALSLPFINLKTLSIRVRRSRFMLLSNHCSFATICTLAVTIIMAEAELDDLTYIPS